MYILVWFHYDSSYRTSLQAKKNKIVLSTHYIHSKQVRDKIIKSKTM